MVIGIVVFPVTLHAQTPADQVYGARLGAMHCLGRSNASPYPDTRRGPVSRPRSR